MTKKILWVLFISAVPVIELRGAIPVAAATSVPFYLAYLVAIIGNLIPVPFILMLVRAVIEFMQRSKVKIFNKISNFIINKGEKNKDKITKYATWGLMLFVAIPLPGTGAWTGALVAAMLEMKFKYAMLSITAGVLIAGVIMTAASYGVAGFLSFLR